MIFSDGLFKIRGRLKIFMQRPSNISIATGHRVDYDHVGWFGTDDEHADDYSAAAGGESDRVFIGG